MTTGIHRFGVKEEYMCFLNEFVEQEIKNMRQYIERISVSLLYTHNH